MLAFWIRAAVRRRVSSSAVHAHAPRRALSNAPAPSRSLGPLLSWALAGDIVAGASLALVGDAICQLTIERADKIDWRRAFAMCSFGAFYTGDQSAPRPSLTATQATCPQTAIIESTSALNFAGAFCHFVYPLYPIITKLCVRSATMGR